VLIALTEPDLLPLGVRSAILAGPNVLSVVVYWEVLLKNRKGNLDVGDPRTWWVDALDLLAATPLALRPEHVAEVYKLPPHHKDPFDRILIAQAIAEDLHLVTTDRRISLYTSSQFRVVA
jgi:PIN domain nuclease of toxin-antitoxin system